MVKPLLPWDSETTSRPKLVWRAKLDNRYLLEVHHTGNFSGNFYVFDHNKNDQEIARWEVNLSYGALFEPDEADVQEWREKVVDFIDNTYSKP